MSTQALLLEILISGFFAIACLRSRAAESSAEVATRPRDPLKLRKPARSKTR